MRNIDTLALFYCITISDIYNAMELINMGRIDYGYVDKYGNTPLIWACYNKMPEIALALIATGNSNPGHINKSNTTALLWACWYRMPAVAMALLATGQSNPGHERTYNCSALSISSSYRCQMYNVVDALLAIR